LGCLSVGLSVGLCAEIACFYQFVEIRVF